MTWRGVAFGPEGGLLILPAVPVGFGLVVAWRLAAWGGPASLSRWPILQLAPRIGNIRGGVREGDPRLDVTTFRRILA